MAIAKDLLRDEGVSVSEVAERVGYSSQSTFSVAFMRQVGASPTSYASGHARRLRSAASALSDRAEVTRRA